MSQKRDPIVAILNYFETAEPALARQALSLAQAVLRRRTRPTSLTSRPSTTKKPATKRTTDTVPTTAVS